MPPSKQNSDVRPAPGNGLRSAADDPTDPPKLSESNIRNGRNGTIRAEMAMFSCDLRGNFTACDQTFTQLFGYAPEELRGKTFDLLFSREGQAPREVDAKNETLGRPNNSDIAATVSEQGHYHAQLRAHPKPATNCKFFAVRLSLSLLRDGGSVPVGLAGFVAPIDAEASRPAPSVPSNNGSETAVSEHSALTSREIDGIQFILASPIMHKFMVMVDRIAGHTETVLVTGETGTGKELIARSVHESSYRRGRPWIDINCAALPENLVESELFGYEKGAFSGADASKPGLFELADRGTLFLDEIGELQLQTQVKLLRVLDGQPFYRLGGHRKIKVDVRIVAATNQDLESAVRDGRFRKDLFHRLGQLQLRVPPLRERPEDIVALAEHFLRLKAPGKNFSSEAISALLSHPWPGNIRELRNLVARVAMESSGSEIDFAKVTAAISGEPTALRQTASLPASNLESMEEQMIIKALERTGGQRALAAEQLGISRRTLSRKLKEYNINFAQGSGTALLAPISNEQQKFFRARVQIPVTVRNAKGEEICVQGVNLSTGGMGLDGLTEPLRFSGLLDVSFILPESDIRFEAKARLMWIGDEKRVGIRFAVIEPAIFEQLQHWSNKKMREEGWDFPS
jgi:two-component system nitrogen regulation response regulator NtrX